jgi:carboxyl-terminal processing protease
MRDKDGAMGRTTIVGGQVLILLAIGGCGGGESGGGALTYTPGVYPPSATLAARCENPRRGTDPRTGERWPDRAGSALHEKHFLRSWTNELYLWFNEVPDRDPANTGGSNGGVKEYFAQLKTTGLTGSGRPRDNFHFTYDTEEYRRLSEAGLVLGYGISWKVVNPVPPREIVVEYVQAGSPAAAGGIERGDTLLKVDGINVVTNNTQVGVNTFARAAFEPDAGSSHAFEFIRRGSTDTTGVRLTAAQVAMDAVPLVDVLEVGRNVGYLLFNDHSAIAEAQLFHAVGYLADAQVDELVLDLRYNGGGFLDIASELAYMIAGPAATAGRTFERLQFNSKYPTHHPLTGAPLAPLPFHATARNFSMAAGTPLPTLNLDRVYVLTSPLTCSASESLINGLRGIGIQVVQVGDTTCGKPYGFYPADNCGTTYFSIQFRGVNDLDFGDYVEGFSPSRFTGEPMANLPGCPAADDLTQLLGDPAERQLATALAHLQDGTCLPVPPGKLQLPKAELMPDDGAIAVRPPRRSPWRDNRILRP